MYNDLKRVFSLIPVLHLILEEDMSFANKISDKFKNIAGKIKNWFSNVNWKHVLTKVTDWLVPVVIALPFVLVLYIILWFMF